MQVSREEGLGEWGAGRVSGEWGPGLELGSRMTGKGAGSLSSDASR